MPTLSPTQLRGSGNHPSVFGGGNGSSSIGESSGGNSNSSNSGANVGSDSSVLQGSSNEHESISFMAVADTYIRIDRPEKNYGKKKQLCDGVSFTIEMPTLNNFRTEMLEPEQIDALLKEIEKNPRGNVGDQLLMALYTGMRRGEIWNLRWSDLDFDRGFIKIVEVI